MRWLRSLLVIAVVLAALNFAIEPRRTDGDTAASLRVQEDTMIEQGCTWVEVDQPNSPRWVYCVPWYLPEGLSHE